MKEILDNLNYFSVLTQDTLSAFHTSGIDNQLYEDVENLKRAMKNIVNKQIRTVEYDKTENKYKRIFTDGSHDFVVNFEDICLEPADYPVHEIRSKLEKESSPIYKIKEKKIKTVKNRKPITPIEKLFFSEL